MIRCGVALVIALAACGEKDMTSHLVYVEPEDTLAHAAIVNAADEWNRVCGVHLSVVEVESAADVVVRFDPRLRERTQPPLIGQTVVREGERTRVFYAEPAPAALAHELGHTMGLPDADHGIMKPVYSEWGYTIEPSDCP